MNNPAAKRVLSIDDIDDTQSKHIPPTKPRAQLSVKPDAVEHDGRPIGVALRSDIVRVAGVVVVIVPQNTSLPTTVAAIAQSILERDSIADQKVARSAYITYARAANAPNSQFTDRFVPRAIQPRFKVKELANCARLNLLSPEGAHIALGQLDRGTSMFSTVPYKALRREEVVATLVDLNREVNARDASMIVFVQSSKKDDTLWLSEHAAAYVEIEQCEPSPGAQQAFVMSVSSLSELHLFGIGRAMVEASFSELAGWNYTAGPFIAEKKRLRLAWYLRFVGTKVTDIAKILGIDQGNVSRGLASLLVKPENMFGIAPPSGWRDQWSMEYDLSQVPATGERNIP